MLQKRVTVPLIAFFVLSGGVAANVFLLQSPGDRGASAGRGFDATSWNIAAIEAAEFGDTGSLGQQKSEAAGNGLDLAALAANIQTSGEAEVTTAIQRELQIRGYETGSRDGVAGTMTRGAIMAFEHDHGLPLTGVANDDLLKSIVLGEAGKADGKPSKAETAEARELIATVQRALANLGYKTGNATGAIGPETARAIRAFEADQAMPASGRVSGPLIARLERLAGKGRVAAAP